MTNKEKVFPHYCNPVPSPMALDSLPSRTKPTFCRSLLIIKYIVLIMDTV